MIDPVLQVVHSVLYLHIKELEAIVCMVLVAAKDYNVVNICFCPSNQFKMSNQLDFKLSFSIFSSNDYVTVPLQSCFTVKSNKSLMKKGVLRTSESGTETGRLLVKHSLSQKENNFCITPLFFPNLRRRRTKLQAHLKESRSLKNYAVNSHNALEAKTRAPDINMPMHEVNLAFFFIISSLASFYGIH